MPFMGIYVFLADQPIIRKKKKKAITTMNHPLNIIFKCCSF